METKEKVATKPKEAAKPKTTKELIIEKIKGERKERTYGLVGGMTPESREINTHHRPRAPLFWHDPDTGENLELYLSKNQNTPFRKEQKGAVYREELFFSGGLLRVPATDLATQMLLAFHPQNEEWGGRVFFESKPDEEAEVTVETFEQKAEAYSIIGDSSIEDIEKIMYHFNGELVFKQPSSQLKRDLYLVAEKQPEQVIDIAGSTTAYLQYVAAKAISEKIINVNGDRVVSFANGTSITVLPVDKTNVQGLADFFATDKGEAVLKSIKKQLK